MLPWLRLDDSGDAVTSCGVFTKTQRIIKTRSRSAGCLPIRRLGLILSVRALDFERVRGLDLLNSQPRRRPTHSVDHRWLGANCKHYSHLARLHTRIFSRACGSRRIAAFCARHLITIMSHATFSTLLDAPRTAHSTAPTQNPSTSSSLLFPSTRTPSATPLFGRFAEQSPA